MLDNEDDAPASSKKKFDKNQPVENLTVTVDGKKGEKSDSEDPKPRIVLTFRSEKSGSKNSNMKIVTSEEKHEEFSPRRSSRTRSKWEWTDDNDSSVSPKKDKSQSVSENEEVSDSSTPKRSSRRRSKDSSENVLANAIARKEKSYNEAVPTQRLSRRIKPTAKILANEELRIGLESQNNARLGIQSDKPEEGVRTRRSARPAVAEQTVENRDRTKAVKVEDSAEDQEESEKLRHLCELGLKAKDTEEEAEENRESEDNECEILEEEDEEIDDDSEVISKLLEADDETISEGSDDDFSCSEEASQTDRPTRTRRSTRLNSSYGINDSDHSSPVPEDDKAPPRRSSRRSTKHYSYEDDQEYVPRRKKTRASRGDEPLPIEVEHEENSGEEPAGGDEGSEAACPEDDSAIIATCYCEAPSKVFAAPSELTEPVFCQAIEMVDGIRVGCSHTARREDGELAAMIRAGPRAPYFLACALHTQQMRNHMCCPACGLFCTQGIFYQCSEKHLFHLECGLPYNDVKPAPGCPHCGVRSYRWQPANKRCVSVRVHMHCTNKRILLPEQREQWEPLTTTSNGSTGFITNDAVSGYSNPEVNLTTAALTPAYLSFSSLSASQVKQGPIIPEDLLPTTADLELLKVKVETPEGNEDPSDIEPLQRLREAIEAGETVDQLVTKIASVRSIDARTDATGATCAHVAARAGRVGALHALRCAGADLDLCDDKARTPLVLAVQALLEKDGSTKSPKHIKNETSEDMEVDEKEIKEEDTIKEEEKETEHKPEVEMKETEIVAEEDLIKVVQYLIAAGCDVNFPGPEGLTALHMCAAAGGARALALARFVLAAGDVRVDVPDLGGWTPLVWAAEHAHAPLVRLLLEAGADANVTDNEGNGAVHWCALGGDSSSLVSLLEASPTAIEQTNQHKDTPLHIAARHGHYSCVVILLARGARTSVENAAGETPLAVCGDHDNCRRAIALNLQLANISNGGSKHRLLTNDISRGHEHFPVPCVNEVDDENLPDDFTYVTTHVMPENIVIDNTISTLQGCSCKRGSCSGSACACCVLGVRRWYGAHGRLQPGFPYHEPPMLFECNHTCACGPKECGNNVVTKLAAQGSLGVRACVFRRGALGWGLRARQHVARGAAVALYCGELLTLDNADTRANDQYMFALDVKPDLLEQCSDKTILCVDAAQYGSAARFINHSCCPNLAPVRVFTRTRDLRLPAVVLFATRDIRPDEELTFDYGDKFWSVKSKWMKCECGSPDCRYPEVKEEEEV